MPIHEQNRLKNERMSKNMIFKEISYDGFIKGLFFEQRKAMQSYISKKQSQNLENDNEIMFPFVQMESNCFENEKTEDRNVVFVQKLVSPPFEFNIHFLNHEKLFFDSKNQEQDFLNSGKQMTKILETIEHPKKQIDEVFVSKKQKFENKLQRKLKFSSNSPIFDYSKFAISNLLGSIGHFHGKSLITKIKNSSSENEEKRALQIFSKKFDYLEANDDQFFGFLQENGIDILESHPPKSLFCSVPSRTFFPRGFFWDEGFFFLCFDYFLIFFHIIFWVFQRIPITVVWKVFTFDQQTHIDGLAQFAGKF